MSVVRNQSYVSVEMFQIQHLGAMFSVSVFALSATLREKPWLSLSFKSASTPKARATRNWFGNWFCRQHTKKPVKTVKKKPCIQDVYSVSGNSPCYFRNRSSFLREQVSVTKTEKKSKNDVVYTVVFRIRGKTRKVTDCYLFSVTFSHQKPLFAVMRAI